MTSIPSAALCQDPRQGQVAEELSGQSGELLLQQEMLPLPLPGIRSHQDQEPEGPQTQR